MNAELIELSDPVQTFSGVFALFALGLAVVLLCFGRFGRRGAGTPEELQRPEQPFELIRLFRLLAFLALLQAASVVALIWLLLFAHLGWPGLLAMAAFSAPIAVAYLHFRKRGRLFGGFGW